MSINIAGVENFSVVDYPGAVAAVIFMQGCPWKCPFCYNHVLQKTDTDSCFLWSKFLDFLKNRQGLLDAVVFSGGEPLMQNTLAEAIKEVKDLGYKIGLHTGGYRPEHLQKILPLVNWVGLDIKAPWAKYDNAIGTKANVDNIQQSLQYLLLSGINFECRTTCDPRILEIEDIKEIASFLKNSGVKKYFLQKYRPVEGDKTQDWECEKFFASTSLITELKNSFQEFEVRK